MRLRLAAYRKFVPSRAARVRCVVLALSISLIVVWNGLVFRMSAAAPFSLGLAFMSHPRTDASWLSALLAMVAVCVAFAAVERLSAQKKGQWKLPVTVLVAGSVLMSVGSVGLALWHHSVETSILSGVLCGAGMSMMLCSWIPITALPDDIGVAVGGVAVYVCASVLFGLVFLAPPSLSRAFVCLMPILAAGGFALSLCSGVPFPRFKPSRSDKGEPLAQAVCLCVLGFAFFMGILGFDFDELSSDVLMSRHAIVMGAAAAASAAIVAVSSLVKGARLSIINPLLLATSLVLLPLSIEVGATDGDIVIAQTSLFVSYVLTVLAVREKTDARSPSSYAAGLLAASSALTLAGIACGGAVRSLLGLDTSAMALTALFALYSVFLAFVMTHRKRETIEHVITGPVVDEAALASARADVLFDRHPQLSARERDVIRFLLQNYSNARIAEALTVSDNTVKTHVRHIYAKLGISSRQQLMALAESIPLKRVERAAPSDTMT